MVTINITTIVTTMITITISILYRVTYMGGFQNRGPFLDPHFNTAPNI